MRYLLDTNVICEWMKPEPAAGVTAWLNINKAEDLYLSVISFAELRRGVDRLAEGERRRRLDRWVREELPAWFEGRVPLVTLEAADAWGELVAASEARGRRIGVMDGFLAAIAFTQGMTLVTRNVGDFSGVGIAMFCPWEA